jgi:glycosyltransferase involved in cell wall biosynthesis
MPPIENWDQWSSRFPTNAELLLAQKSETVRPYWLAIGSHEAEFEHDGIRLRFLKHTGFGKLSTALSALRPDVIHLHGINRSIRLMYNLGSWAERHSIRCVVQDHGGGMPRFPLKRKFLQSALRFYAHAIFGDEDSCKRWVHANLIHSSQARVLFAASSGFSPVPDAERLALRRRMGMHGSPVFGWAAHLNQNKDPLTILRAFGTYVAWNPEAHLYMHFMNDDLLDDCKKVIDSSEIMKRCVRLLGPARHDEMEPFFQSIDYLLQGSHFEAYGFSVAEAMACGAIPIVSDIPSFRLLTENGRLGYLFPAGDMGALANLLQALPVPSNHERDRIAKHFKMNFSYPALVARLERLYLAE